MKLYIQHAIVILSAICLMSCNKNSGSNNPEPKKLSTTPIDQFGSAYNYRIKLWKNGVVTALPDGAKNSVGNSVFVSGSDVYVAGYDDKAAKLWKNGVATALTDGTSRAEAKSVYVSGNNVYVAGFEYIIGYNMAKIWKNGQPSPLSDGNSDAMAFAVCVLNNDVYVAGYSSKVTGNFGIQVATVWINGVAKQLSDLPSSANSICVSGNDIYVGGEEHVSTETDFRLWKNGVLLPTSNNFQKSFVNSVYVSGNDVYAVGKQLQIVNGVNTILPLIWKNNTPAVLSTKDDIANSVFVSGNDVYVAGSAYSGTTTTVTGNTTINEFGYNMAQIWKNGVGTSLTNGKKQAAANSVFVSGNDVYVTGYESDR